MSTPAPRVSLGMPLYNGQRFLREVLDSIIAQTYTDWELIISDNGSTDATESICREYAQRDPRILYHANDHKNHGPAWNYNRTEALARGEFFKWVAGDDVLAPTNVEKCVAALDADPGAVMSWPRTRVINEKGETVREDNFRLATDSPKPHVRFGSLINVKHRNHGAFEIFSLIRLAALRSFTRKGSYARADSVLLARLSLFGRFKLVEEFLFLNRDHSDRSVRSVAIRLMRGRSRLSRYIGIGPVPATEWWDASRKGKINFPEWRIAKEYWTLPDKAPLSGGEKFRVYLTLLAFTLRVTPKLTRDVVIAVEELFWRVVSGPMNVDGGPSGKASKPVQVQAGNANGPTATGAGASK